MGGTGLVLGVGAQVGQQTHLLPGKQDQNNEHLQSAALSTIYCMVTHNMLRTLREARPLRPYYPPPPS